MTTARERHAADHLANRWSVDVGAHSTKPPPLPPTAPSKQFIMWGRVLLLCWPVLGRPEIGHDRRTRELPVTCLRILSDHAGDRLLLQNAQFLHSSTIAAATRLTNHTPQKTCETSGLIIRTANVAQATIAVRPSHLLPSQTSDFLV